MSFLAYPTTLQDVRASAGAFRIWNLLAVQDIRQRYRRSILGPFWNTLSLAVSILAIGLVYTRLFKVPTEQYLPFLSVGFVVWVLLSSLLIEACGAFVNAEGIIKQVNLPLGVHVLRTVWRAFIVFAHHVVVLVLVLAYMRINPGPGALRVVPALLLTAVAGVALGYLLGGICARFRDIAPIIASLVQVAFYVTPVIWDPSMLKGHPALMTYNPLFHFLEILRAPLLGKPIADGSWETAVGLTIAVVIAALAFMARYRRRIAYWL